MARDSAGLTQEKLAEITQVPQQTISKIERGDQETSSYTVQLAIACNVRPQWLALENGDIYDVNIDDHNLIGEQAGSYPVGALSETEKQLIRLVRKTGMTSRFVKAARAAMDALDELADKD